MITDEKKELFETMPVRKAVMKMAVPTVISQLVSLIYNMVDTFFIGRTGNSYMMASVTLAFTVFVMTTALANMFGIGGGSLIARLNGRQEGEEARRVSTFSFYGAVAVGLLYSLLVGVFLNPLLMLLGASEDTLGYARQYLLLVVVAGSVPTILSMAVAHLLRNVGYSRQASIGLSCGGLLNVVLDPLFMFVLLPPGWEVFGAALATLISNIVACCYLVLTMRKVSKKATLSIDLRTVRGIRKSSIRELFAVGIPSSFLTALFDLANIVLNSLISDYGDLQLAAMGIVMKAERLPNSFNIGICQGMLPIVAYNFASGNRQRMNEVIRFVRRLGLGISVVTTVLYELFATPVVQVFLSTTAGNVAESLTTITFAAAFLRVRCLSSAPQFVNYHTSFCLQAMGDGRDTLLHSVLRELGCYIPAMYLLNHFIGLDGLVWGVVVGESCGAVIALILLRRWLNKCARRDAAVA